MTMDNTRKPACSGRVCDPTAGHRPAESKAILPYTRTKRAKLTRWEIVVLAIILLVATLTRTVGLGRVPPGLSADELANSRMAERVLNGDSGIGRDLVADLFQPGGVAYHRPGSAGDSGSLYAVARAGTCQAHRAGRAPRARRARLCKTRLLRQAPGPLALSPVRSKYRAQGPSVLGPEDQGQRAQDA